MNAETPAHPTPGSPFRPVAAQPPAGQGAGSGSSAPQAPAPAQHQPRPTGPFAPPSASQPAGQPAAEQSRPQAHPGAAPQSAPAAAPQHSAPQSQRPPTVPPTGAQPTGTQPTGTQPTGTQPAGGRYAPGEPRSTGSIPTTGSQPQGAPRRASFKTTGSIPTTGNGTRTSETNGMRTGEVPEKKGRMAALADIAGVRSRDVTDTEPKRSGRGGPRKVRVMLSTVDPWSILKLAFLVSVAAGVMMCIGVYLTWQVLSSGGVLADIQSQIITLFAVDAKAQFLEYLELRKWMSATILVAVFNVVLWTALSAVFALLYNVVVKLVGGVYVTLTDE